MPVFWKDFRHSGGVLGALGALLARLGGLLARLGGILRHLGAILAHRTPSRRLWGGSWGRFWLILADLGGVLGAHDGPKFLPRWPKMPLRCLQDSPRLDFQEKSEEKMSPSSSDGIFHPFFVRFYLKNTSPIFEKS